MKLIRETETNPLISNQLHNLHHPIYTTYTQYVIVDPRVPCTTNPTQTITKHTLNLLTTYLNCLKHYPPHQLTSSSFQFLISFFLAPYFL